MYVWSLCMSSIISVVAFWSFLLLCLAYLYIIRNDRALTALPPAAAAFSPRRFTTEEIESTFKRLRRNPIAIQDKIPPRTGRRYIIVGGAGFLGGWIVVHLLKRGEDPKYIRVLDIRAPTREDLTTGRAIDVDFRIVDISDADAVNAAFCAPWPSSSHSTEMKKEPEPETTVIHTAANIRFFERVNWLIPLSAKVNVEGTQNIINACQATGVSTLVYTSSGSALIRRARFWLWPWEKQPNYFVQAFNDDSPFPERYEHYFSNYAYTKRIAEELVRKADRSSSGEGVLRTGCLRPGNGIFGPGGDILCGAYLVRKVTPSWVHNTLQNFVYVENCSLAHLCYEQRLIELSHGSTNPDIGGHAFCVTDLGPPITYGDSYKALTDLTKGETVFPRLSPTSMLLIAHVFEAYYLTRQYLLSSSSIFRLLAHTIPPLGGDLVNLQPSLFALTDVHLIFDDSRARLPPSQGGLGYAGPWTTLEGLCKLVDEHVKSGGKAEARQRDGGGIGLGFGFVKAQRGVERVAENVGIIKPLETF